MSNKHLAFIRSFACLVRGCMAESEAHHVRNSGNSGTGIKPDDRWAVPMCHAHHMELHQHGFRTFEQKYRIDLAKEAEFLWSVSGEEMP